MSRVFLPAMVVAAVAVAVVVVAVATVAAAAEAAESDNPDPAWDHQTKPYMVKYEPAVVTGASGSIAAFFSPDESTGFLTELVESARTSVAIGSPGFSSWIGCTYGGGCSVPAQRFNETFPIFPALLNALGRGVSVRILTNNYDRSPPSSGNINPLAFLALAGADVRFYTSTTFWHAKYISVDGGSREDAAAAFSSINFSQTSFRKNREAGMRLQGREFAPLLQLAERVFDADFAAGDPLVPSQTYSPSQMALITSRDKLPVVIPRAIDFPGSYVAKTEWIYVEDAEVTMVVSPDHARDALFTALYEAKSSFTLYIYQVTDPGMCEWLKNAGKRDDFELRILVSDAIFDSGDYYKAAGCYRDLIDSGIRVRSTRKHMYSFSHQKLWIIDGTTVWLSTGNWSPTDYPAYSPPGVFPPHNGTDGADWIDANRDFTLAVTDPSVVDVFVRLFEADYALGQDWWQ